MRLPLFRPLLRGAKAGAPGSHRRLVPVVALVAILCVLVVGGIASAAGIIVIGPQKNGSYTVPSNQIVRSAGSVLVVGDRPTDMVLRPDGKQIALMTTVFTYLVDPVTQKVTQKFDRGNRDYAGLAYSPDGKYLAYAKGDSHEVAIAPIGVNDLVDETKIINVDTGLNGTGNSSWPGGLSYSPDGTKIYVALFGTNQLGIIDVTPLSANPAGAPTLTTQPVGSSPFGAYATPDGKAVYVSNWAGDLPSGYVPGQFGTYTVDPLFPNKTDPQSGATNQGTVSAFSVSGGTLTPQPASLPTGLHPTAVTFDYNKTSHTSTRMFVANSNSDTVSVFDITQTPPKDLEDIDVRPDKNLPFGSMPNGLTLSPDGGTLYVANGGNNAIAVVTLGTTAHPASKITPDKKTGPSAASTIAGFIPTEWFPVAVATSTDGSQIYVANNKGEGSVNNDPDFEFKSDYAVTGSISFVGNPTAKQMAVYNKSIEAYNHYKSTLADALKAPNKNAKPVPVPARVGEPSVFKHVIYIIKENRTYDQIFGDMGKGNSDPNVVMFGNTVTPNIHALARRFGLLDNFYATSVNSADGHQWTDQAVGTVFAERIFNFYPTNSLIPGVDSYGDSSLDTPPDSLWSNVVKNGLSFRNYGENGLVTAYFKNGQQLNGAPKWIDVYRDWLNQTHQYSVTTHSFIPLLDKYIDPAYPPFDSLEFPDQWKVDEWQREFNAYVANYGSTDPNKPALPALSVIWLPQDHTSGTSTSFPTPEAMNADNDYAQGRIIDALSNSPYWKDTAVFVTEDDAQNGVDHVDGHRTEGMVVSAYNKKNFVDSSLFNETSMVRTIEQILGLKPINQFDLTAPLMTNLFTNKPDLTPYQAITPLIPLDQLNAPPPALAGQAKTDAETSNKLDFHGPDRTDPAILNPIIWRAVKGTNVPYPTFTWKQQPLISDPDGDGANDN